MGIGSGIGELFTGLAQGVQAGVPLGQRAYALHLQEQKLTAEQERAQALKHDQALLGKASEQTVAETQDHAQGAEYLSQISRFAAMPKQMRKNNAAVVQQMFQQATGSEMPESVLNTLLNGEGTDITAVINDAVADGMGGQEVIQLLGNPQAMAEAMGRFYQAGGADAVAPPQMLEVRRVENNIQRRMQTIKRLQQARDQMKTADGQKMITTQLQSLEEANAQDARALLSAMPQGNSALQTVQVLEREGVINSDLATQMKQRIGEEVSTVGTGQLVQGLDAQGNPVGPMSFNSTTQRVSPVSLPEGVSNITPMSVQANTQGNPFSQKDTDSASTGLLNLQGSLAQMGTLLNRINDPTQGELTGARGQIGSLLGGTLGQILPQLTDQMLASINAASPEEIQNFMVQARTVTSQAMETLLNETGKITDSERKIIDQVTGLISSMTSPDQARGALSALMQISILKRDREAFVSSAGASFFNPDPFEESGQLSLAQELFQLGFSRDQTQQTIEMLQLHRQQLQAGKDFLNGGTE